MKHGFYARRKFEKRLATEIINEYMYRGAYPYPRRLRMKHLKISKIELLRRKYFNLKPILKE